MPFDDQVAFLIDRFKLVQKLRLLHWQQVCLGAVVALAAVAYNVVTPPAEPQVTPTLTLSVAVLFLVVGGGLVWWRIESARRYLAEPAPTPRERALRLAESATRIGNAWLSWATAGNLLLGLGTLARLKFSLTPEALVLWVALLPTIGLLSHGVINIPSRKRLLQH